MCAQAVKAGSHRSNPFTFSRQLKCHHDKFQASNMHDKFINATKTLSLVPVHLHISGTVHTHLKGITFLCSFKALEQEKRILETEKCQTGNLWQTAQQGVVLVYLQKTSRRILQHQQMSYFFILWARNSLSFSNAL